MNLIWKGAAILTLTVAGLGATAIPAQAQYYGGSGWRDTRDVRWDNRRWDNRRWDSRRHWRGDRRGWRGPRGHYRGPRYGYRQRCWTEWRNHGYRNRRVKVRVCN